MELPDQSAAAKIFGIETPASAAAEVDTLLVEWAQNIAVSIPAFDKVDSFQQAIVALLAGWKGFFVVINKCLTPVGRFGLERSQCFCSIVIGQMLAFCPNWGKK